MNAPSNTAEVIDLQPETSQQAESKKQPEKLTFETAFERLAKIDNTKSLARFARRVADSELIYTEPQKPYFEGMQAYDNDPEGERLIAEILKKREEVMKKTDVSKKTSKPRARTERKPQVLAPEVADNEIVRLTVEKVDLIEDERTLEQLAFTLFRAGLITKTKRSKKNGFQWTVKPVENVEGSKEIVDAILNRKHVITGRNMRYKAFKALSSLK